MMLCTCQLAELQGSGLQLQSATKVLFRLSQNSNFFHSLSTTSIFRHMYETLNVDKKITNYIVWL